jgi:hypothetical protein
MNEIAASAKALVQTATADELHRKGIARSLTGRVDDMLPL